MFCKNKLQHSGVILTLTETDHIHQKPCLKKKKKQSLNVRCIIIILIIIIMVMMITALLEEAKLNLYLPLCMRSAQSTFFFPAEKVKCNLTWCVKSIVVMINRVSARHRAYLNKPCSRWTYNHHGRLNLMSLFASLLSSHYDITHACFGLGPSEPFLIHSPSKF